MIHHFAELQTPVQEHFADGWAWRQIGVFPVEPDDTRSWFNYTVGLGMCELWMPCASIEGRCIDNHLNGAILNTFAGAWSLGLLAYGDQVVVPLGIPDADGSWLRDADAVWWVSTSRVPSPTKQVHFTGVADWTVPCIWSSPLGWPDE